MRMRFTVRALLLGAVRLLRNGWPAWP